MIYIPSNIFFYFEISNTLDNGLNNKLIILKEYFNKSIEDLKWD